jgi:hypothetical protein
MFDGTPQPTTGRLVVGNCNKTRGFCLVFVSVVVITEGANLRAISRHAGPSHLLDARAIKNY